MERRLVAREAFALRPSFAREQWLVTGFAMLFLLAAGPALIVGYALYDRHLRDLESRWSTYRAADGQATYDGRIRTSRMLLRRYQLTVGFTTQEGAAISFQTSFSRLFTGPDSGDPLYVRYDPQTPHHALTSWEFESTHFGHYLANGALLLGLSCLLIGGLFVRDVRRRIATISELAREGRLVVASVERVRQVGASSLPMQQITLRMPGGGVHTQVFYAKLGEPYFLDAAAKVLVLCSPDERTVHVVREDGYPLAERPSMPEGAA